MRQQLGEYCHESAFAPLAQVSKARSTAKKISWAIIAVGMTGYMIYYCTTLLITFFNHPVKYSFVLAFSAEQEFPSITICNLNPVKLGAIRGTEYEALFAKFNLDGQSDTSYLKLQEEYAMYVYEWTNSQVAEETLEQLPTQPVNGTDSQVPSMDEFMHNISYSQWDVAAATNTSSYFNNQSDNDAAFSELLTAFDPNTRERYSHKIKDMLLKCEWKGFPCSPRNFSSIDNHKYGQCFTFNAAIMRGTSQPPLKATRSGPLNGLLLELYIEQDEYVPVLSPEAGMRVVIHGRGQMPFPEEDGFTVSPGFATAVGIKKTVTTRLDDPYGVCADHGNTTNNTLYGVLYGVTYSSTACQKSCLQTTIMAKCGCAYPRYVVPKNSNVCNLNKKKIARCVAAVEEEMREGDLNCTEICPDSCNEESYGLTISSSVWPSENYRENLRKRLSTVSSKMITVAQMSPGSSSSDQMTANILKLEVYFSDLNYYKIEQTPAYEIESLISDVGGQLGLWLGVSLLAFGELLELMLLMGYMVCCRGGRVRQSPEKDEPEKTVPYD